MTNINVFGDAVSYGGLVDLYREAYEELEREFPHLSGHLALYFDNDPRPLKEVLSGYFSDPGKFDAFLPKLTDAMTNPSSLVGTFAGDYGSIEGVIVIRHVSDSFDPAKQEELMWGSISKRPGFPFPNPPWIIRRVSGSGAIFTMNSVTICMPCEILTAIRPERSLVLKKEMFADTFATFALYKRYGPEVMPILKHFSNVRVLEVALKGSNDYYTSPAILEAMDRIMAKRGKFSGMSLQEMEDAAVPIVNKTMKYHRDSKTLSIGVEPLKNPDVQAVLLISVQDGMNLLRQLGLKNYALKYQKAINDLKALNRGESRYTTYEP